MTTITNETPIAILTLGQLLYAINNTTPAGNILPTEVKASTTRYVYGLSGIRGLFNVSHTTAQRYKNTFLKDAVKQNGKKIVVDADKALELFNKQGK